MAKTNNPARDPQPEIMVDDDDRVISRAFRGSLIVIVGLVVVGGGGFAIWKLNQGDEAVINAPASAPPKPREIDQGLLPDVPFVDITSESGIDFSHANGARGMKLLPETMGGGVAFFDYDNDGDQDLFFVNSCSWPGDPIPEQAPTMALYANDGQGRFTDVTVEVGLDLTFYGMGVAVADYDNDGWRDLFLTAVGSNRLLRNEAGKFIDVTSTAGVAGDDNEWSTSCGFFDFDNDQDLDLFVCNYVRWSKDIDLSIGATLDGVSRAYGPPKNFSGTFPYLYRNEGDGRFVDVSAEMGLQVTTATNTRTPMAKSLGVVFDDTDNDGWQDIVVANDTVENMLFRNVEGKEFIEEGLLMGIGTDSEGRPTGAMGIDVSHMRNNDAIAIAIGNFANEPLSLFVAREPGMSFTDQERSSGIGTETRSELSFGVFFFDVDLDGRLDVFTANGHLENEIQKRQSSMRYEQPPHLLWNAGPKSRSEFYTLSKEKVGEDFVQPMVGRGASYADIDGDGDIDIVVTGCGQPPRLLRNEQQLGRHFLRLQIAGPAGNPDGIGAKVELQTAEMLFTQDCRPTRSYCSQVEPILTFGLGATDHVQRVKVVWPDGTQKVLEDVEVDQTLQIAYPESE